MSQINFFKKVFHVRKKLNALQANIYAVCRACVLMMMLKELDMEVFLDQLWIAMMSAFVVLGFVVVMTCTIWIVKIVAEKLIPSKQPSNTFFVEKRNQH